MKKAILLILSAALIGLFCASLPVAAAMPFQDVPADAWYARDVEGAVENGLINGKSATTFAPQDAIRLSEAVKLAACVRQLLTDGAVSLRAGSLCWYEPYAVFCRAYGILDSTPAIGSADWNRAVTRGEVMELFARALPTEWIRPLNEVTDGAIPDVPMNDAHADAVYALYRAGIAQGGLNHACRPDATVIRAEIAAMLTRMTDKDARVRFTLDAAPIPASERQISPLALEWAAIYDERFGNGASDEVILTAEEIVAYNRRMTDACPTLRDMTALPETLSGAQVRERIGRYLMPENHRYNDSGNRISDAARQAIDDNRALDRIPDTVRPETAVIAERCDLKGFPTEMGLYVSGDRHYSGIQETELIVGTPVRVLHRSADGQFYFVEAAHYDGWIPASAAALCDAETYAAWCAPTSFVTVTSARVTVGGVTADMGAALPYRGAGQRTYRVLLPGRDEDGRYVEREGEIPLADAVPGRLPYTMKNFYQQAFSYLGTLYGWGGADGGVDCSGFVCAVMRCFGVSLPRNTSEQRAYGGTVHAVAGWTAYEKTALLESLRGPVAVHRQGHVMLFLGERDGKLQIVHAARGGEPVRIEALDPADALLAFVELK